MGNFIEPTDKAIAAARQRGRRANETEPRASRVSYAPSSRRITIGFPSDVEIVFDVGLVPELAVLSDDDLMQLEIGPSGDSLECDPRDVQVGLGGLLLKLLNAAAWKDAIRSELNREAARITSEAKAAAARVNGTKGGRPRKLKSTEVREGA